MSDHHDHEVDPAAYKGKGKQRPTDSLDYNLRSLAAGGIAGGTAKTALAPFERVRILFQVQHQEFARYSGSLKGSVLAVRHILRTQGFRALYRGHSLSLARAVPHAAVGFTAYEHARALLMPTPETNTPARRFLAGAIAGLAALPITYPFELVRVRMATDSFSGLFPNAHRSPFSAVRSIWASVGLPAQPQSQPQAPSPSSSSSASPSSSISARPPTKPPPASTLSHLAPFYRGFPITVLGSVPYRGGIFLTWETLHASARRRLGEQRYTYNRKKLDFLIGALSGAIAQAATYPLEIVRRRQQVANKERGESGMVRDVIRTVWKTKGWRGFYVGMGLGLVKQVPMHAISLGTWQMAKRMLDI